MENITKMLQIKKIILICTIFLWMVIVFYFSSQSAVESDSTSSQIVNIVINLYEKITNKVFSIKNIEIVSYIIRKIAHFTLYFIGSIPVLMLFKTYSISNKRMYICTILFCFIYSCSDELHQLFSQGRNANIIDILIDTIGSVCGIIFLEIVTNIKKIGGI